MPISLSGCMSSSFVYWPILSTSSLCSPILSITQLILSRSLVMLFVPKYYHLCMYACQISHPPNMFIICDAINTVYLSGYKAQVLQLVGAYHSLVGSLFVPISLSGCLSVVNILIHSLDLASLCSLPFFLARLLCCYYIPSIYNTCLCNLSDLLSYIHVYRWYY